MRQTVEALKATSAARQQQQQQAGDATPLPLPLPLPPSSSFSPSASTMTQADIQSAVADACRETVMGMLGNSTSGGGGGEGGGGTPSAAAVAAGANAQRIGQLEERMDRLDDSVRDLLIRSDISTERQLLLVQEQQLIRTKRYGV